MRIAYFCVKTKKNNFIAFYRSFIPIRLKNRKVTKFGEKRTKTVGVANRFMVGGHNVLDRVKVRKIFEEKM